MKPIRITDEQGKEYTLEFDVASIKEAEAGGFVIKDVENKPMTAISDLFYYAFKKHHPNIRREQTDKMIAEMGGIMELPQGLIERLAELYLEPFKSASGVRKNAIKVEL